MITIIIIISTYTTGKYVSDLRMCTYRPNRQLSSKLLYKENEMEAYNKPEQLYCPKYGLSVFAWKTLGIIRCTHQVSHGSGHQRVLVSLEESQYVVPPYTQCCHVDESE